MFCTICFIKYNTSDTTIRICLPRQGFIMAQRNSSYLIVSLPDPLHKILVATVTTHKTTTDHTPHFTCDTPLHTVYMYNNRDTIYIQRYNLYTTAPRLEATVTSHKTTIDHTPHFTCDTPLHTVYMYNNRNTIHTTIQFIHDRYKI